MVNEGERATRSRETVPLSKINLSYYFFAAKVVVVVLHRSFEFNDYIWLVACPTVN